LVVTDLPKHDWNTAAELSSLRDVVLYATLPEVDNLQTNGSEDDDWKTVCEDVWTYVCEVADGRAASDAQFFSR